MSRWKEKPATRVGLSLLLAFILSLPLGVTAAQINDRSLTLSDSAAGAVSNYTFNLSVPSSTAIKSFRVRVCETPDGACNVPTGFNSGGATLLSQPVGFGMASGWVVDIADNELLRMHNAGNNVGPSSSQSVTFGGVVNPSASNQTFFVRMSTYANANYSGLIDEGVAASATTDGINIAGTVPPILAFCVAISIPGDCTTATGANISMGNFSPSVTATGTSQMRASTNAGNGYVIAMTGTTLSSGSNTIPASTVPTNSQIGTSQFGVNLRDNSTPNVGAEISGAGTGEAATGYNIVNQYQFNNGDVVASALGPTDNNTYTVAYITNIAPFQAAGSYSTTLTYIITAAF